MSNQQIAVVRGVSINTVRSQVSSLLQKSGVGSRKALARWRDSMERQSGPSLRCSFCGKHSDAVEFLVAGPAVYICGGCIELCNGVITKARERR
jgi:hypothetical protein